MNKIGFQNFRRFLDFKPLEYKGITFLVGRNNSGKSTLVKALLLTNDYFKNKLIDTFSFGNSVLEDANIVTYGRAKNQFAEDNTIIFSLVKDSFNIQIILTGENDETHADVFGVLIEDDTSGVQLLIQPKSRTVGITKTKIPLPEISKENTEVYVKLVDELTRLKNSIDNTELKKSSREYLQLVEEYNSLKSKRDAFAHNLDSKYKSEEGAKHFYSLTFDYSNEVWLDAILDHMLDEGKRLHDIEFAEIQNGKTGSKNFENLRGFKLDAAVIERSIKKLISELKDTTVIYLGANPAKQSALFPIRDRQNALAQAVHDFYQLKVEPGSEAYRFVEKWMKEFEIGESFKIKLHAGEAYEVLVHSHGKDIPLADKGMGSIQAMLLILRLACIICKVIDGKRNITVIIEEPELNLHPALQSKLADIFLEVNQTYKLNFIVETHSEYVIRKSQVIVAEKEFSKGVNENPFNVYYFPKNIEEPPYLLGYQANGRFDTNFGEGFFDEATNKTMTLLKLEKSK